MLVDKFVAMLNQVISWASGTFNIDAQKITDLIAKTETDFVNSSSAAIGQVIVAVGKWVVVVFLVPVYIFLLLLYHPLLIEFIRRFFARATRARWAKS